MEFQKSEGGATQTADALAEQVITKTIGVTKVRPVARMRIAKPVGYKDLHRLPDQIPAAVAKQRFSLGVDQDDCPFLIHHHHPTGRCIYG